MPDHLVVAHDYLTQSGGAERVALELARRLGARELITSVYAPELTFGGFDGFPIRQSASRLLQAQRADIRRALPLLAPAWSQMPQVDADVLVCSSSGWSHGLRATDSTFKVVYCHNPARWLYQRADYATGASAAARTALTVLAPALRRWDQRAARSADLYLANSTWVAARVLRVYGLTARVVHPPMSLDATGPQTAVDGIDPGYFLTVSRARGYKGTSRLIEAFARMPEQRLVVVGWDLPEDLTPNVTALSAVSEEQLRWLYAHARALMSVSHEDFGLTPVEAGAFGTPSLLLRAGGFTDSTEEDVSGSFVESDSVDAVMDAVRGYRTDWDADLVRANAARFSPEAFERHLRRAIGLD